jgi:hypothetical protein
MVKVKVRAAIDKGQQSFYRGLDMLAGASKSEGDGGVCAVLTVSVKWVRELYTLPSKYNRRPSPFIRLALNNRHSVYSQCDLYPSRLKDTSDTTVRFEPTEMTARLPIRSPADTLSLQVMDDRPFGPPVSMGKHKMAVGELADYFSGVECEFEGVGLEGVPRGQIAFSVVYDSVG